MSEDVRAVEHHLQTALGRVLFGMDEVIHGLSIALIARGHVLLEGPPGLGKTLLGKSFAAALGGRFKRIQGTADLMPADITGVHVFHPERGRFEFQPGPVFTDVLLVDEVNRAGPRTQSALLEAMEERQVTVDRDSFPLPDDFLVIATQNPREFEGTYPLPESQLDRFALSLRIDYPSRGDELTILDRYNLPRAAEPADIPALAPGAVGRARAALEGVHVSAELTGYVLDLAAATRQSASIGLGLSTRGALTLLRAARVEAALRGGDYVIPDDVKRIAPWVIRHRLVMTPEAALEDVGPEDVLARLLDDVAVPG
ncbi:MAG TPA: MoxR family ATPase [Pseudomonadales bacterium]